MQTTTLLVYLHGKGFNSTSHADLIKALCERNQAELLAFNAPFAHKQGFKWFDKIPDGRKRRIDINQFNQSVEFIISKVEEKLHCRECGWQNVILCGHSQGGVMALHLGLTMCPAKVISLCGDFPADLSYASPIDKTVPIYWVEAAKDTFLSQERKNSWKRLQDWGCNLNFLVSGQSTHNHLDYGILNLL